MLVTFSFMPIVVVLSGSMEPAYYRGDLLISINYPWRDMQPGDVEIFKSPHREISIVHRIARIHGTIADGNAKYLTKGDNNDVDDISFYQRGSMWLTPEHVQGTILMYFPSVGYFSILMNDYPQLKYALLAALALTVLLTRGDSN